MRLPRRYAPRNDASTHLTTINLHQTQVRNTIKNLKITLATKFSCNYCINRILYSCKKINDKIEKLTDRLRTKPKDFTWDELVKLLHNLGFKDVENSKTGGSRRKFYNVTRNVVINLHKPHPRPYIKGYMLQQIIAKLTEEKIL